MSIRKISGHRIVLPVALLGIGFLAGCRTVQGEELSEGPGSEPATLRFLSRLEEGDEVRIQAAWSGCLGRPTSNYFVFHRAADGMEVEVWEGTYREPRERRLGRIWLHWRSVSYLDRTLHYFRNPFPLMESTIKRSLRLTWIRDGRVVQEEELFDPTGGDAFGEGPRDFSFLVQRVESAALEGTGTSGE